MLYDTYLKIYILKFATKGGIVCDRLYKIMIDDSKDLMGNRYDTYL